MLDPVEPWIALSAALALVLAIVVVDDVRRRRALIERSSELARADAMARRLDERAEALRLDRDALLELGSSGLVRVGSDRRVLEANGRAASLLGRPAGDLVGRSLMEVFLDPEAETIVGAALEAGSSAGELRPSGPDGAVIAIAARPAGGSEAWLVLDDVSELRRLQRIRAEFIDNLSHELRTPLTTVSLLAETLSRDAESAGDGVPARMRERIVKIEVETGHLVQMVNELLDLTRIESGATVTLVDGLDLGTIAAEAAERLRLFAERQGVELRVEAAPGLPPVRGDAARLGQVVVNLVHNAVKFSPDGGDVVVRAVAERDTVVVSVEDHGVGIPRAAQDRVFERFYKVDRSRLRAGAGGGTGLGLAISRHVVEAHGGRIWVTSREGQGSTFSFSLPIASG
jgi:two-component system phosphate regulon sensor histidine kinase PhoR